MRFLIRLVVIVVVVAGLAVGSLFLIPADRLGRIASEQLTRQLGRDVTLGEVSFTVWPELGLDVRGIALADLPGSDAPMIRAERGQVRLDTMAALRRSFIVRGVELQSPDIRLRTDAQGRGNWEFGSPAASGGGAGGGGAASPAPDISLERLVIRNGALRYAGGGAPVALSAVDLDLRWPDTSGPMDVQVSLALDGVPLSVAGRIAQPLALGAGGTSGADLTLGAGGAQASFDGILGTAPELSGQLSATVPDLNALLAVLGQGGGALPVKRIETAGAVTLTRAGVLSLREGQVTVDGQALRVAADVFPGARPRVNAQIEAGSVDLSFLAPEGRSDGATAAPVAAGWSSDPIDASALGLMDGEISFVAAGLRMNTLDFGKTRVLVTIDNARAVAELRELQAWQGVMTGSFIANNRSGLSVRGQMQMAGVDLTDMLRATVGVERLSGQGTVSVDMLGVGQSQDAIMRSLKGSARISAGPGVINGIDLDRLLRGGDVTGGTTVFDTLTASFTVTDGVLRGDDLTMGLPALTTTGEGQVDLGGRSLDYLLVVNAPAARGGRGLAVPVRIKGPWSSPRISADLQEAIDRNLAEERDALEQQVRDRVNDKLEQELGIRVEKGETLGDVVKDRVAEELGVAPQEGQSVEDAVRDKVEQEVGKRLLDLLNR